MAHKTFVLVHGAWHGGWCWRRVADLLESKGHKVFTPTLTGLGERSHLMRAGIDYGVSCLGCCWALMCLLFVVGVMNLLGIAAIAIWVLAEKTLASGLRIAQAAAVGLIGWGSITLALAILSPARHQLVSRPAGISDSAKRLQANRVWHPPVSHA